MADSARPNNSQKLLIKILVLIVALVLLGIFVWRFNLDVLKVTTVKLSDPRIKNEITLVQISDLHGKTFGKDNQRLLKKIRQQSADAVMVTGDLFTNQDLRGQEVAFNLMQALAADPTPVFYVTGEHDYNKTFHARLTDLGVKVLAFSGEQLQIGDTVLEIYGINSVYFWDSYNLANEIIAAPEYFSILLAHIPNWHQYQDAGFDLVLSGDTHGGQIRLPFVGALWLDGWFPEQQQEEAYIKGLYSHDGKYLYVNSGLGTIEPHFRLWNRPEITVIKLTPSP
ncbi:MAG: metallophosphoesterase [Saccharofermentanales bacterium]|jgi:predicted MPP superfamily phosphohydrolase